MRLFHLLQRAHGSLFRAADQQARRLSGLTMTQSAVLFVLAERDGQPVSDIAASLAMGKSSLTGLIDRLVEKGLVRRDADGKDGRVTLIHIEQAGEKAVRAMVPHVHRQNAQLLAPFSAEEREVIRRFLTHLAENSEKIVTAGMDEGNTK